MTTTQVLPDGKLLLDGQWVSATKGETIPVVDPATQEVIQTITRGTKEDVDQAVESAHRAFKQWSKTSPTERGRILDRWHDLLNEHLEEVAGIEARDVGQPLSLARGLISGTANSLHYYAGAADKLTGVTLPSGSPDYFGYTLREPHGVCAIIFPWNLPAMQLISDTAPALAAGNTVVAKPPEDAPLSCIRVAQLGLEAGLPPGVLNLVFGYGEEAGAALSSHPGINHMSFTGSPETGAVVMAACAKNLVPVKLELGGKSPHIVLEDADLKRAVPTVATSITFLSGQACIAGSRLLVSDKRKDEMVEAVAKSMSEVTLGAWDEDKNIGPLINKQQYDRVIGYLDMGKREGARVATGGGVPNDERLQRGYFVEPTVFDNVTPDMRIAREEIFGPVLSVLQFHDEDEAAALANDNAYGLSASIWTSDLGRAHRLASQIDAGMVGINQFGSGGVIGSPFATTKKSGFLHGGGYAGMMEYTKEKAVSIYIGS